MKEEKLKKELVRVTKRLALNGYNMMLKNDNFEKIIKKIERPTKETFSKKEKESLSELLETRFYNGKAMAYGWVLKELVGVAEANRLLLKGVEGPKNYDKYGKKIK